MAMSAAYQGEPVPSMMCPPRMMTSKNGADESCGVCAVALAQNRRIDRQKGFVSVNFGLYERLSKWLENRAVLSVR